MSAGLLDFFVLEASDYVDRLQRLVTTDDPQGPDSGTFVKLSRGLRGSAVMARLGSFAEAATGLERAARLQHEGRIAWTTVLSEAVTASIAELRSLIPMARHWGESHDLRARSAAGRLSVVLDEAEQHGERMQSGDTVPSAPAPTASGNNPAVSAFFDFGVPAPTAAAAAAPVPPTTSTPASPTPVMPRAAESVPAPTPFRGVGALTDVSMPIVPIASLAPDNDLSSVVYAATAPSITFAQRFVADVSPLIGSLRARLSPLRQGAIQVASEDMVAAFRPVLLSLRDTAASYEHVDIQEFCDAILTAQAPLPAAAAGALDTALTVMLQQDIAPQLRAQRLAELRRVALASTPLQTTAQSESVSRPNGLFTPRMSTPIAATPLPPMASLPMPTIARPTPAAPSGRALNALLNTSLEKVRELDATPIGLIAVADPLSGQTGAGPDGEREVVPIDSLLYRGPRALSRARHIVGQLRTGDAQHDPALISELFDLVELAGSHP